MERMPNVQADPAKMGSRGQSSRNTIIVKMLSTKSEVTALASTQTSSNLVFLLEASDRQQHNDQAIDGTSDDVADSSVKNSIVENAIIAARLPA